MAATPSDRGSWQPATSRSTLNPHYFDPVTGAPSRDAIPQTAARFGRTLRRVLQHGAQQLRLEWRNTYCQVDDPGEVAGPNPVRLRASIEYPAGTWRQVDGSTAWASTVSYAAGEQVLYNGRRYVTETATTAGQSPGAAPWVEVRVFPVHWAGQDAARAVVIAPGVSAVSDPVELGSTGLLAGRMVAVNMLACPETAGGRIVSGGDALPGDFGLEFAGEPAPGSEDDLVDMPVTVQASMPAGSPLPMPTVVEGWSPNPNTVAALGDSLFQGLYDDVLDGDTGGFVPRALRATQHYRMSVSGARADSLTLSSQVTTWRDELFGRYSVVLTDLGGNDAVYGDGTTSISSNVAMVQQRMTALWRHLASRGPRVWATTMTPWTSSTDGWATVSGQSRANHIVGGTTGLDGVWGLLRDWLAAGAPITAWGRTVRAGDGEHPLAGIADVGYAVTDPGSGWKWRPGLTTDGMHPNATGHQLLARALAPHLPALEASGTMADLPAGSFGGHWAVPLASQPGGGPSKTVSGSSPVLVDTLTRTIAEGLGCTMTAGVFEPLVAGEWRFEFTTQWCGGSSAVRAMMLREVTPNGLGGLGAQGLVSDAMSSGASVRLAARQRMGLYVANWSPGTVQMWNDGLTQLKATWLGP